MRQGELPTRSSTERFFPPERPAISSPAIRFMPTTARHRRTIRTRPQSRHQHRHPLQAPSRKNTTGTSNKNDRPRRIASRRMRISWKLPFTAAIVLMSSHTDLLAFPNLEAEACGNWQRACAQLWGNGTKRWRQCMSQPQAIQDCQANTDVCDNWHVACVRLYGWQSRQYRSCMRQPQALADCGLH